jgi:hypothetical protein
MLLTQTALDRHEVSYDDLVVTTQLIGCALNDASMR